MRSERGFTLVEAMIVLIIIAILTSAGAVMHARWTKRSTDPAYHSAAATIWAGALAYRVDHRGKFPAASTLQTMTKADGTTRYIRRWPTDPRQNSTLQLGKSGGVCEVSGTACNVVTYTVGANGLTATIIARGSRGQVLYQRGNMVEAIG